MTGLLTHVEGDDLEGLVRELERGPHSSDDLAFAAHRATCLDRAAHVRLLVQAGADISFVDPTSGWTLMHIAVEHGCVVVARALVESGIDVDARCAAGTTPLHLAIDVAADAGHQMDAPLDLRMIERLLDLGASPSACDSAGRTPMDWAGDSGVEEISRLLQGAGSGSAR